MRRRIVLGTLVALGGLALTAAAMQQPPAGQQAPMVVEIDKLKDNLFVMKGGGGNSSVFVTAKGVIVVDTKNPGWGQPLLDAIKKVTNRPVTMIVNTHPELATVERVVSKRGRRVYVDCYQNGNNKLIAAPFCVRAKRLLDTKGIPYEEISVEGKDDLRTWLVERSGQKTVPQVFVGERSLGGFSDIDALDREGRLDAILRGAA